MGWDILYPKMHSHTKFGIPITNYMRYALDMSMLRKTRSEVKVKATQKWYAALPHPTMHLNTKFGILTSKNIGDMHRLNANSINKVKVTVTYK